MNTLSRTANGIVGGALLAALLLLGATAGAAGDHAQHAGHTVVSPTELSWGPGPPALPPGIRMAVLTGNPAAEGPFTVRGAMPAGYTIPPHWHPGSDEHLTVLSGTVRMGTGETMDESTSTLVGPGGFAVMPAGLRHWMRAEGEAVLQVHGTGPFVVEYVNPADDPRQQTARE